jgi:hypothetical protein
MAALCKWGIFTSISGEPAAVVFLVELKVTLSKGETFKHLKPFQAKWLLCVSTSLKTKCVLLVQPSGFIFLNFILSKNKMDR